MIFNLTSPVIRSKDRVPVLGEDFTYSGSCTVIDDSNDAEGVQWRIKFLTSGSLVIANDWLVDLFLVGGGRSGNAGARGIANDITGGNGGAGGAGGQCKTIPALPLKKGITYTIVIGGSNGDTSALEQSTSGGGASGGSGGTTAATGGSGSNGTYEFGETGSDIYGGGGGGGGGGGSSNNGGTGGAGGAGGACGGVRRVTS